MNSGVFGFQSESAMKIVEDSEKRMENNLREIELDESDESDVERFVSRKLCPFYLVTTPTPSPWTVLHRVV